MNEYFFKIAVEKGVKNAIDKQKVFNSRVGYEWESPIDKSKLLNKIDWIRKEIKRISSTTLRGNFTNNEDRKYWEDRLTKLNSELIALEELV